MVFFDSFRSTEKSAPPAGKSAAGKSTAASSSSKAQKIQVGKAGQGKNYDKGIGASGIKRAMAARKAVLRGTHGKIVRKPHYKPRFYLPRTLKLARSPKYPRKSINREAPFDHHSMIFRRFQTDKTSAQLSSLNTLTFIGDVRANKLQISYAIKKLLGAKPEKVRTLIGPDGKKKIFVKFKKDTSTLNLVEAMGGGA